MNSAIKKISVVSLAIVVTSGIGWLTIGPDWRALIADLPTDTDLLFWEQSQREVAFKMMDKVPWVVKSRSIQPSVTVRDLPEGKPLTFNVDMEDFFVKQQLAGALILHHGRVRYERYGLGLSTKKRWTSFSVAKSIT